MHDAFGNYKPSGSIRGLSNIMFCFTLNQCKTRQICIAFVVVKIDPMTQNTANNTKINLFIANIFRLCGNRCLHREQREDLKQMILHHVPNTRQLTTDTHHCWSLTRASRPKRTTINYGYTSSLVTHSCITSLTHDN